MIQEFVTALLATLIVTLIVLTTIAAAAADRVAEAQMDSESQEPARATTNPPVRTDSKDESFVCWRTVRAWHPTSASDV
jgi:hypothetical protein